MNTLIHAIVNWLYPQDVVYYGPHRCPCCASMVCRASLEQGGKMFDYPDGIIYPNTQWRLHECRTGGGQF